MSNVTPLRSERASLQQAQSHTMRLNALKSGDGGGIYGSMEPASKEYVDLKLEASIGRIEAKLASMPSTAALIATAFTASVGVVSIILAAMAFGSNRFDGGLSLASQRQEQLQRDAEQDATIKRQDALLSELAKLRTQEPERPTE